MIPERDFDILQADGAQEPFAERWARQFHEECGTRWDHHDNSDPQAKLPFGCLPETVLRWKAGDR